MKVYITVTALLVGLGAALPQGGFQNGADLPSVGGPDNGAGIPDPGFAKRPPASAGGQKNAQGFTPEDCRNIRNNHNDEELAKNLGVSVLFPLSTVHLIITRLFIYASALLTSWCFSARRCRRA